MPADFMPLGHLRQSIGTILLSWSLIVAGSGDVELFGHLHRYATEVPYIDENVKVNFGQELAIHQVFLQKKIRKKISIENFKKTNNLY